MKAPKFPEFIKNLPEADLPVDGARAWLVQSEDGQVMFLIDGEMELTIGEKTGTYRQGDSYFIPAGTMHKAILYKDFRVLDYFADKDRYKTKG
jgi:mannose-6-phosphate isomerase-like protein (cupin superfamily)